MRQVGRLVKWDESRGFGFIQPEGGGPQVFVHISKIAERRQPAVGDRLSFDVARDLQNRLSAAHVRYGEGPAPDRDVARVRARAGARASARASAGSRPGSRAGSWARTTGPIWLAAFVAIAALLTIGIAALQGRLPILVLFVFLGASFAVFMAYAFDKSAAMNRRRRTPENILHLMNLLGGWPGGLIASQLFRHKSKKLEFRTAFYFSIVLNCAAIGWLIFHPTFLIAG
jgi:uncharacterized membrane protein YsdA (DUF1294 family)/cold shock CspA family protein